MMSDDSFLNSLTSTTTTSPSTISTTTTNGWRTPVNWHPLAGIGVAAHQVAAAVKSWARMAVLPYAALWEASFVVSRFKEEDYFEPDRYATEMPFLKDSWPRE